MTVSAQSTDTAATDAQAFGTGLVTLAAADAEADVNVDTEAYVGAANITLSGGASVTATSKDTVTANSGKLPQNLLQLVFGSSGNFGAVASGTVIAKATIESKTKAHVDNANINSGGTVALSATATDQTTATTFCLTVGAIFAGLTSNATATETPEVDAYINGAAVQSGGDVDVTADAETSATTAVDSGSLGIVAVGPSQSSATDSPTVKAYIDTGSTINAGGKIVVQGSHNTGSGTGAKATADASSEGIAGYGGANPTTTANASVNVYANPGAVLQANGNISFTATSNNYGDAEANSFFLGALGAGTSSPTTTVDGKTLAHMDGTVTGGQSLTMLAQTSNLGTTNGVSGSGALIGGIGINSQTTVSPTTQASIGNNTSAAAVRVSGNISVTSQTTDNASATGAGGAFGVIALGVTSATATLTPTVTAFLGNSSSLTSTAGSISLTALHNYDSNGNLISGKGATATPPGPAATRA